MARLVVLLLLLASFVNIVVADNTSQKGYLDIKESSFNFGKFSNQPCVSGTHTDVFFRLLAVRVCVKEISSAR